MATSDAPSSDVPPPSPHEPAHDPFSHTLALLQPWIDYVPQQQRRLGLFIFLAFAVHVATFFFITIDTSPAELRHQPHNHISLEFPQAVAVNGQAPDRFWDRLNDPRAFLFPMSPPEFLAGESPPIAINPDIGAGTLPDPALPENYRAARAATIPLDQQVLDAMAPPRLPFVYNATPRPISPKTTWSWDDALAARHPTGAADLPSPVSDTELTPTRLQVAISPDGTVEHALVEQSCGVQGATIARDLDQQAVMAARKIRLQPVEAPGLQWGYITVFWHYSSKPREEVVPTPPTP